METGDGVLAWRMLRLVREYREVWARHATAGPQPAPEPGPFRIRVQTEAARFELLTWEGPHEADGPVAPFWRAESPARRSARNPWRPGEFGKRGPRNVRIRQNGTDQPRPHRPDQ